MKITDIRMGLISVPLRVPFKTALRSVNSVEDVVVEIHTDSGEVGYGEAPPTGVITGGYHRRYYRSHKRPYCAFSYRKRS